MHRKDILNILVDHTRKVIAEFDTETYDITEDTYFSNIGASSCDRALIAVNTLASLSVDAKLEDILTANTIGEMVDLICK